EDLRFLASVVDKAGDKASDLFQESLPALITALKEERGIVTLDELGDYLEKSVQHFDVSIFRAFNDNKLKAQELLEVLDRGEDFALYKKAKGGECHPRLSDPFMEKLIVLEIVYGKNQGFQRAKEEFNERFEKWRKARNISPVLTVPDEAKRFNVYFKIKADQRVRIIKGKKIEEKVIAALRRETGDISEEKKRDRVSTLYQILRRERKENGQPTKEEVFELLKDIQKEQPPKILLSALKSVRPLLPELTGRPIKLRDNSLEGIYDFLTAVREFYSDGGHLVETLEAAGIELSSDIKEVFIKNFRQGAESELSKLCIDSAERKRHSVKICAEKGLYDAFYD
ncbi:MAG: hypothetical protein D6780_05265, partial [Candidatus Dadabacteria bacterium]